MAHKPEYEDQIALYSLGLLEGAELREVEDHLAEGCEICSALLRDSETVFTNLPLSLEDAPLPEDLEKKILGRLEPREPVREKSSIFDFWKNLSPVWLNLGAAVSLAAIIFLVVTNISLKNELGLERQNVADLQAKLNKEKEMIAFVMNPGVNKVELGSKMPDMNGSGRIYWDREKDKGLLLVSSIPMPKKGMTYQLWAIENGKPVSMGVFDVDPSGSSMMELKPMPEHDGPMQFAVTLEPAGGMPQPTGAMYLYGSL
ncbi:MAG TPA: anti-sigma factor [Thermodesulfobacteriota bacterium]|nr:anti-sigma factor [Thermodesulfobacteriota bacterium]